jgi:hypothetical protein
VPVADYRFRPDRLQAFCKHPCAGSARSKGGSHRHRQSPGSGVLTSASLRSGSQLADACSSRSSSEAGVSRRSSETVARTPKQLRLYAAGHRLARATVRLAAALENGNYVDRSSGSAASSCLRALGAIAYGHEIG